MVGSVRLRGLGQWQTVMEEHKQMQQVARFDAIRKLFNGSLVSLDAFEQLPGVQWCALTVLT